MKRTMSAAAILLGLAAMSAGQQGRMPTSGQKPLIGRRGQAGQVETPASQPAVNPQNKTNKRDAEVKKTIELPPEPIPLENLGDPSIVLPDGPIDPYLLTKQQGPFMVCAHTFRGPEATRYALALVLELRNEFELPAYMFHLKIQPGGSNIRNVQPTAPTYVPNGDVGTPEKYRVFDEAAVLVGNCGTLDEAEKVLHRVKKIKPKTVDALPSIWGHRKGQGLYRAHITANPLQAAQYMYPGRNPKNVSLPVESGQVFDPYVATAALTQTPKTDPLLKRMNGGPHNIYNCSGKFTLPVAEFRGRSTANTTDPRFANERFLRKSPLAKAGDDAEELAENLMKCKNMRGFEAYVFHDRDRSVVTIGSFAGQDDPNLERLRGVILQLVNEAAERKFTLLPLAPSPTLMVVPQP